MRSYLPALLLTLIFFSVQGCRKKEAVAKDIEKRRSRSAASALIDMDPDYPFSGENSSTYLGTPRVLSEDSSDIIIIRRPYYAIGYHKKRKYPLWVAWHLDASNLGAFRRKNAHFQADAILGDDIYQVVTQDYSHSGFDRGHNCPAGDRSNSQSAIQSTFFMTNITPQVHHINGGVWEHLESYTRQQVQQGMEAYVICGSFGKGGIRSVGDTAYYIGSEEMIEVPRYFWKIVIFLAEGDKDRERIAKGEGDVISVIMPNDATITENHWEDFKYSLDEIQKQAQLSLFDLIPNKELLLPEPT